MKSRINAALPFENVIRVEAEYKEGGIDAETYTTHETYLSEMRQKVLDVLQTLVNSSVERDPEIKSRKKMVQEVYAESLAHLSLLRETAPTPENNDAIERIKRLLILGKDRKHSPILIRGARSTGKSAILARVYESAPDWFECPTFRVVRLCASTPRSAYSLELLRILCEHVAFLVGSSDGNLPRDASFDPLYLNNWFGQIMRRIEEQPMAEQLLIMVDDLHRLHPLECDIVAALSWLPLTLPQGIHFIVTTAVSPESLKLTPVQKERFRSSDVLVELPDIPENVPDVDAALNGLEKLVGPKAANRLGSFLSCTEYGLSETEVLELIMPTGEDGPLSLASGQFNFATWTLVKGYLTDWLKVSCIPNNSDVCR